MTAVDSIKIVPLSVSLSSGAQRAGGQGEMNIFTAATKFGIPVEQLRNFDTDNTNTLNAKEQKLLEVYLQQAQNGQQTQGAQQEKQSSGGLLGLGNIPIAGDILKKIPLIGKIFDG